MPLCNQIGQHDDSDMQALRTNTQLLSLTLPLNRNARANTRQVEMCTCLVLVVWWSALGEALDGLGVFHLGVLGGCLVWGGFAFGGVWWLMLSVSLKASGVMNIPSSVEGVGPWAPVGLQ